MTRRRLLQGLCRSVLATGLAGLLAGPTHAGSPIPGWDPEVAYVATRVIETGKQRIEQRYFHRDARVQRMETQLQGQASIIILRADQNLVWTVMPQQRMVMQIGMGSAAARQMVQDLPDAQTMSDVQREGREDVNGVPATRYRIAQNDQDGRATPGRLWVSDHGIALRMRVDSTSGPVHMELRDLQVGPQPAALFEPPADYQRISLGGAGGGGVGDLLERAKGMAAPAPAASAASAPQAEKPKLRDALKRGLRDLLGRP